MINRSPSSAINFKTPMEMLTGKPLDLSKLKIFGCTSCAYNRASKLDHRAKKCIFLGYSHGIKGYRLSCVEKGKQNFLIRRDVVFDEEKMGI